MESVPRSRALLAATVLLLTLVPLAGTATAQTADDDGEIVISAGDGLVPSARFAGTDRYDTSQLIATDDTPFAADFDGDTVILATGERFPDALAGSTLGGLEDAPIVLTPSTTANDAGELNPDTAQALDDYDPATIYILGEVEAIAQDVEDEVRENYPGAEVIRIGGIDRHETASLIARETADELAALPEDESRTAIVARSGEFADALVFGALAAAADLPLLLTPEEEPINEFTQAALEDLGIERILFAGGTVAISQEAEDALEDEGYEVVRIGGENRYDTAVVAANYFTANYNFGTDHANLARGDLFPDALALGPHAGQDFNGPAPILLTAPDDLSNETADYFDALASCDFVALHVAGGVLAVSEETEDEARARLTATGENCAVFATPASATNDVGETHTVTALVTDNAGTPVAGSTVTFTAEADDDSLADPTPESATVTTSESGTATFSFTSFSPGDVTVTVTVDGTDGEAVTATATKTFVVPGLTGDLTDDETLIGLTGVAGANRLVVDDLDPVLDPGVTPPATLFDEQYLVVDEDGLTPLASTLIALESVNPLYALGDDGQLFTLEVTDETDFLDVTISPETITGLVTATPVGDPGDYDGAALGLVEGSGVGFDFNTTADAFRVVNQEDRNFTTDDETGDVTVRDDLAYAAGDPNEGADPGVSAAAYTVNDVLYVLDTVNEVLAIQAPPNEGTLNTVAELTVLDEDGVPVTDRDISGINGFEIDRSTNQAYVAITLVDPLGVEAEVTGIYTLDLGTGELTPIATVDTAFNGLTAGDLPTAD
jgi:putative cell wall-binding protein